MQKLNELDRKIIQARVEGESFMDMSENDRTIVANQIILTGITITGCHAFSTDGMNEILRNEIITHLLEFGYSSLSENEIFLALRLNSTGWGRYPSGLDIERTPFSGYTFNVDYFSKVMATYLIVRKILDRKLQNFIDGHE